MKLNFYKERGFFQTLLAAILVISIDIIPQHYKTLFVGEGGHLKILGGGIGVILAIGLFLKWNYVRPILATLTVIGTLAVFVILLNTPREYILSYVSLLLCLIVTLYLLIFSKAVKYYVEER